MTRVGLLLIIALFAAEAAVITVSRCPDNPIITPASGDIGTNINGPSVVRVPDWVQDPLGRYYLYFADHQGTSIRLAFADDPAGPWTVSDERPFTLDAAKAAGYRGHIASPDVHIDEATQRIVMFFHGSNPQWQLQDTAKLRTHSSQASQMAVSTDGRDFQVVNGAVLGFPYLRVFWHRNRAYALSARGLLFRATSDGMPDGSQSLEEREAALGTWRHCAVLVRGDHLLVIFSRKGDKPERLLYAEAELGDDWQDWQLGQTHELLRPEHDWEGADLPIQTSVGGAAKNRLHEVRDPAIFTDRDGSHWLYYSIAGESGIAVARLDFN